MSTRKDQLLRRAAGNERSRAVAITREEKALRAFLENAGGGGSGHYILTDTCKGEYYVVSDGAYEAIKDAIINSTYVDFVCIVCNSVRKVMSIYTMYFAELRDDGVIHGNCSDQDYSFDINPDNTGRLYYSD